MAGDPTVSVEAVARRSSSLRGLASSRVVHLLALAVPFAAVAILSGGLRHPFASYQTYDELHHFYGGVELAARVWPRVLTTGYESWSGPLVYWLLAGLARPFGTTLDAVRLVVAVLSWATCAAAYLLFRDVLGGRSAWALGAAYVLALSPFFFGQSFYVLTDNPTWLLVVLSLTALSVWVRRPRLAWLAAAVVLAAAASLMRQVAVWLFLPLLVATLTATGPRPRRGIGLALVALGLVPLGALLVSWGGLLPSGGAQSEGWTAHVHAVFLSLAVVGLWGTLLAPLAELRELPERLGRRGLAVLVAAAVFGLASVGAGVMGELAVRDPYGIGLLGRLLDVWPALAGTSLLWWLLVPLGLVVLAALLLTRTREPLDRVYVAALAGLVLSTAANTAWYQRYVDFGVLLAMLALVTLGRRRAELADVVRWVAVVGVSVAWTVWLALA